MSDALDDKDSLDCDKATIEEALLDFGQRLNAVLTLNGNTASEYVMQQRDYDKVDFQGAPLMPVYVVRPRQ
jgi:hypothetical protein